MPMAKHDTCSCGGRLDSAVVNIGRCPRKELAYSRQYSESCDIVSTNYARNATRSSVLKRARECARLDNAVREVLI